MNQNFTSKELFRYLKKGELIRNNIDKDDILNGLTSIQQDILNEKFEFEFDNKHDFYLVNSLEQTLVLRKLNDNIKRIYKDEQANRKFIVQQVGTLLGENSSFWIIKTDIKSFYESINRERILKKLKDDAMLSYYSIYLLKKVFDNAVINTTGLPRGLNISSSLSELYLRKFDEWIQRHYGVYFYARFVDDIIIFLSNKKCAEELFNNLEVKLEEICNLTINLNKTELLDGTNFKTIERKSSIKGSSNYLEYLGYKFYIVGGVKKRELKISIADKKANKIKTRVTKAYLDYIKNKNFALLIKRIRFLTGNYGIKKNVDGSILKAGIYYNYPNINSFEILDELNIYHRSIIFCKNKSFGVKLSLHITSFQRSLLNKYCFKAGFHKRTYNSFTYSEMKEIIKCW